MPQPTSKARLVITALFVDHQSPAEVATRYGVHRAWVYKLRARYEAEGETALEPRSRRPKTTPTALRSELVDLIVRLRKELDEAGLDAGPDTIAWHLHHHHGHQVSRATISRTLTRQGLVIPEPKKRPRSSYIRFEAAMPNQTWQSDFTHYRLATGIDVEIISWLDDCTRYALHVTTHRAITFSSRRAAERAGNREEAKVREGAWHDHSRGEVTFTTYVETVWLPSKQVETSTLAAYRSYLDKHFLPLFGTRPMGKILPTEVQRWVTTATEAGLSAASVRKYHTMLSSVFERALRDRVITFKPCAHTELPKAVKKKTRTLAPEEYTAILEALPAQHRLMVETAIGTGLRWGELIALKPRHLDPTTGRLTVEETIVEVSTKNSPTGQRMLTKPYPKDNEPRTMALPTELLSQLTDHIADRRLGPGDLLFTTGDDTPLSRNTFRTRIWRPAVSASGVDFNVRVHDLRHAHASWLLAGGSDLKSVMDRMGHAQITTTQKYFHTLPDADHKTLHALDRIRKPAPGSRPDPAD